MTGRLQAFTENRRRYNGICRSVQEHNPGKDFYALLDYLLSVK